VRIEAVELVRVRLPLVRPFVASYGTEHHRDVLLVHVLADGVDGWGEDVALAEPTYTSEFIDASHLALRSHLLPRVLAAASVRGADIAALLAPVQGWQMAKAALEMGVLDAELRLAGRSLRDELGGDRSFVPVGVSVGLSPTIDETLREIDGYLAQGYRRVKLKIEPGRDIDLVRAVRAHVGPAVQLQVDANSAYSLADSKHLAKLDAFELVLIEQPFGDDEFADHAELARRIQTPVCLDESITSLCAARHAIETGACSIINIKPGRVGGLLEAVRIHDLCVASGVPVWCGGMLESGVGRAANLALASLPGFTVLPDLSASARYFTRDITEPFVLHDGGLDVPAGPGIGVAPLADVLMELGATREVVRR
jgi:o-succinylbenzoate synthase